MGQHVNKVSTAVEVLHKPSGLRVAVSDSRSQSTKRKMLEGKRLRGETKKMRDRVSAS